MNDRLVWYGWSWWPRWWVYPSSLSTRDSDEARVGVGKELINCIRIITCWWEWHDHSTTIQWRDDTSRSSRSNLMTQWLADRWRDDTSRGSRSNSRTRWFTGLRTIRWRDDSNRDPRKKPTPGRSSTTSWPFRISSSSLSQAIESSASYEGIEILSDDRKINSRRYPL